MVVTCMGCAAGGQQPVRMTTMRPARQNTDYPPTTPSRYYSDGAG